MHVPKPRANVSEMSFPCAGILGASAAAALPRAKTAAGRGSRWRGGRGGRSKRRQRGPRGFLSRWWSSRWWSAGRRRCGRVPSPPPPSNIPLARVPARFLPAGGPPLSPDPGSSRRSLLTCPTPPRLAQVRLLTLFVERSRGAEETRVGWFGFRSGPGPDTHARTRAPAARVCPGRPPAAAGPERGLGLAGGRCWDVRLGAGGDLR